MNFEQADLSFRINLTNGNQTAWYKTIYFKYQRFAVINHYDNKIWRHKPAFYLCKESLMTINSLYLFENYTFHISHSSKIIGLFLRHFWGYFQQVS